MLCVVILEILTILNFCRKLLLARKQFWVSRTVRQNKLTVHFLRLFHATWNLTLSKNGRFRVISCIFFFSRACISCSKRWHDGSCLDRAFASKQVSGGNIPNNQAPFLSSVICASADSKAYIQANCELINQRLMQFVHFNAYPVSEMVLSEHFLNWRKLKFLCLNSNSSNKHMHNWSQYIKYCQLLRNTLIRLQLKTRKLYIL